MMSTYPDQTPSSYKLVARTNNVASIVKTLQAVNFNEYATFTITDASITATVEEMRCIQSNASINADCFHEYNVHNDGQVIAFKANLNHVVACLKVHSKNGAYLKLSYRGNGFPLELIVEENGVVTDCQLKTFPPDDLVQFSVDSSSLNRLTMTCDLMKAMVRELDPTSEIVEISISPTSPNLSLLTLGAGGEGKLEIDQSDNTFKSFDVSFNSKASFKLNHLKPAFKPLTVFQMFCMKMDDKGLLRMQYHSTAPNMRSVRAEFYVIPLLDSDDDS